MREGRASGGAEGAAAAVRGGRGAPRTRAVSRMGASQAGSWPGKRARMQRGQAACKARRTLSRLGLGLVRLGLGFPRFTWRACLVCVLQKAPPAASQALV